MLSTPGCDLACASSASVRRSCGARQGRRALAGLSSVRPDLLDWFSATFVTPPTRPAVAKPKLRRLAVIAGAAAISNR
jgi:hypothetical protein